MSNYKIVIIILILINAAILGNLLGSLYDYADSSDKIEKLWQPTINTIRYAPPTFMLSCIIVIGLLYPKVIQQKVFSKRFVILSIFLYLVYILLVAFLTAFAKVLVKPD